eukprot:jgi/Mesvir1/11417/Mv25117-RA.2
MDPPAQFLCPISCDLMREPAMLVESGQIYERTFIEQWFARGNGTDPLTNVSVSDKKLVPVLSLRTLIEQWIEQQREQQRLGITGMDASIPHIAQERLKLGEVLHNGAMAAVSVAILQPAGQEVVVKMFHAKGLTDDESSRFRKEVQILHQASVFCHNVCRLIGVASINGQLCMVMPRYQASLEQMLLQQRQSVSTAGDGPAGYKGLPLDRILSISQDIALAIADLHERGILVLDLKPANILLDKYGRAVVADFGISALRTSTMSRYNPTFGAQGTPNYMAPEQWIPQEFGGISTAADAWGFGCIVVEMASTATPWAGMNMFQIMTCVTPPRMMSPAIPDSLPSWLVDILRRCFAYQPTHRPAFAEILVMLRQGAGSQDARPSERPADTEGLLDVSSPISAQLADMDVADDGRTLLHVAAQAGRLNIVRRMVAGGANKEAKDKDGQTPLYIASKEGHLDIVMHLVARGANKEAKDKYGWTSLHIASVNGRLDIVKHLVASGANKEAQDENGGTPLHIASGSGHLDIVMHLVTSSVNKEAKDKDERTPLHIASINGFLDIVMHLVASGANKEAQDEDEFTPLHSASRRGHLDIVKHLVASGANMEAQGKSVGTPLHIASENDRLHIVRHLVASGATLEAQDKDDRTPLHIASMKGHLDIVMHLVASGANKEALDKDGQTPLYIAAQEDRQDVVKYLVACGSKKEAKNKSGRPALDLASTPGLRVFLNK